MEEENFVASFHKRMASHPMFGPQGAINLKHDAWAIVVKHVLVSKGIISAEEFDSYLKQQLDDFERMVAEKAEIDAESPKSID